MKIRYQTLLFAALFCLIAASAQAEPGHRGPQDLNEDGQIDRAEFDQWADELFTKSDVNGDQVISEDEKPQRPARRSMRRRGPQRASADIAAHIFVKAADENADGAVENGEWQVFLSGLVLDVDGAVSDESLQALMPRHRRGYRPREPMDGEPLGDDGGELVNPEEIEELRVHFAGRLFDTDDDGSVTVAELDALYSTFDSNSDGDLAADELPRRPGQRGLRGGSRGQRGPGGGVGGSRGGQRGRFGG